MRDELNYWSRVSRRQLSRRSALKGAMVGTSALGAAYLVGCGDDDDDDPNGPTPTTAADTTPTTATGDPTATPEPARGGDLVITHPYPEGALTLDPHTQESDGSQRSIRFLYNNLLRYIEERGPGEREMVGDLVESWEQPDSMSAVFTLREGVKFQNLPPVNGRVLTAEDVVYSFERMKTDDPRFVMRSTFATVENVEALDDRTVRFTTPFPYAPLLHNIAFPWASIVAREVVEQGDIENSPVGTGPFILEEYARGATLRYRKNPDYFKAGLPYLDTLETPIMPDYSARIAAFRAGQTGLEGVRAEQVAEIERTNPDVTFHRTGSVTGSVIRFNCEDERFSDPRVRQAITYATNVQDYIDVISGGEGVRTGPMPSSIRTWALDESEFPTFDLAKAKALMEQAGYGDGFTVSSSATVPYSSVDLTEITAAQLKEIGIDVKIDVLDNAAWIDQSYRATDFAFSSYQDYAYSDPDRGLRDHYHSAGALNNHRFGDPDLDVLLDQQRETVEFEERHEIVQEIQRRLLEFAPRVWLYIPIGATAVQPWLKGYHPYVYEAGNSYQQYEGLWIERA